MSERNIGKENKRKGKYFENKVVKIFKKYFPEYDISQFKRTPFSKKWGDTEGDILLPDNFKNDYKISGIECKYRQELKLENLLEGKGEFIKWIKDCERKFEDDNWLLVFQKKNCNIYVLLPKMLDQKTYIRYNNRYTCIELIDFLEGIKNGN